MAENYLTNIILDPNTSIKIKDQETSTNLASHINNKSNPHNVTKAQVGLGNVDNVSQASILNSAYPVGSIYMSTVNTSPALLFGGTWERIKDCFLLSAGDTYTAGSTGGEATHTLTVDEMPRHTHEAYTCIEGSSATYPAYTTKLKGSIVAEYGFASDTPNNAAKINTVVKMLPNGANVAHNNIPPYVAVYMWKRMS